MPAYMLVEVAIHDAAIYEEYKKRTPAVLEAFEGKFLLRGLPVQPGIILQNTKRRRVFEIRLPRLDFY